VTVLRFLKDVAKRFGQYVLMVIGGVSVFMTLALVVGYLPYSDRPGPGWYGWFEGAAIEDLWHNMPYVLGFATLAAWTALFYVLPVVVLMRLLARARVRQWLLGVLGALVTAMLTFPVVAGAGWYISIGVVPVLVGAILGAGFGATILAQKHEAPATAR
jgi:hypothetical protein